MIVMMSRKTEPERRTKPTTVLLTPQTKFSTQNMARIMLSDLTYENSLTRRALRDLGRLCESAWGDGYCDGADRSSIRDEPGHDCAAQGHENGEA